MANLVALAIRFDQLIRDGVVADYTELARLRRVNKARVSSITNLLNLPPDIQEEILHLKPGRGRDRVTERRLRPIVAATDWRK